MCCNVIYYNNLVASDVSILYPFYAFAIWDGVVINTG